MSTLTGAPLAACALATLLATYVGATAPVQALSTAPPNVAPAATAPAAAGNPSRSDGVSYNAAGGSEHRRRRAFTVPAPREVHWPNTIPAPVDPTDQPHAIHSTPWPADQPQAMSSEETDIVQESFEATVLVPTGVEFGAHSVLFTNETRSFTRAISVFRIGPFDVTGFSSDRAADQSDTIFDSPIRVGLPSDGPVYVQDLAVRFVDADGVLWEDIPASLLRFELVKVHPVTGLCRESEYEVVDLCTYEHHSVTVPEPYGLMLNDPEALPHHWNVHILIQDTRVSIGNVYAGGGFSFYLEYEVGWTNEPHLNTHNVLVDALDCPGMLDQRTLVGL